METDKILYYVYGTKSFILCFLSCRDFFLLYRQEFVLFKKRQTL